MKSKKYHLKKKAKTAPVILGGGDDASGNRDDTILAGAPTTVSPSATTTDLHAATMPARTSSPEADVEAALMGSEHSSEEEEVEQPSMSVIMTICFLAIVTVFVAVTAEWLVDSIDGLAETGAISKEIIGLILLPIVGNAAGTPPQSPIAERGSRLPRSACHL